MHGGASSGEARAASRRGESSRVAFLPSACFANKQLIYKERHTSGRIKTGARCPALPGRCIRGPSPGLAPRGPQGPRPGSEIAGMWK